MRQSAAMDDANAAPYHTAAVENAPRERSRDHRVTVARLQIG